MAGATSRTRQQYYEVITLASDCLSDLFQILCAYARRSQRNQFIVSNWHHNIDHVFARTSSTSFRNDDRIRHPSHQDKVWRQNFLCCWTAQGECSSRRYKKHYRLVILQTSHKDTFLLAYSDYTVLLFPTVLYSTLLDNFFRGSKMHHINGVLLTYLLTCAVASQPMEPQHPVGGVYNSQSGSQLRGHWRILLSIVFIT